MVHGDTFKVIQVEFDISKFLSTPIFNKVIFNTIMVSKLFGKFVTLSTSDE